MVFNDLHKGPFPPSYNSPFCNTPARGLTFDGWSGGGTEGGKDFNKRSFIGRVDLTVDNFPLTNSLCWVVPWR